MLRVVSRSVCSPLQSARGLSTKLDFGRLDEPAFWKAYYKQAEQSAIVSEWFLDSDIAFDFVAGSMQLTPAQHAGTVVELGCGASSLLEKLAGRFPSLSFIGTDCSQDAINEQRKRSQRQNLSFQVQDITDMSFEPGSVCTVIDKGMQGDRPIAHGLTQSRDD